MTTIEVKPLRGWRIAAMGGYAVLAVLFLGWIFSKFPLPSISIDPTSPWALGLAMAAVPITLWLTIGITRWLPSQKIPGTTHLSLL